MDCPSQETLRQLCDGTQPHVDEDRIVTHIDGCARCQSLIEQFGVSDSEVAKLFAETTPSNESLLLRECLNKLKMDRPSSSSTQGNLRFQDLSPWIDAGDGVLGRIDEYDLIRCIGRGGMGVVFEAFDRKLQRPVALKLMAPALLTSASNSERFLREARAAAAINHPNVVSIYAVSKIRELPYLIMELVDGCSLQQQLVQNPPSNIEDVSEIAAQIADGLAAAHSNGVVHRDIKPANILIELDSGRVKVTDFGLARRTSDGILTNTETLLGTPEYLAPEQVDGGAVDSRADLYSLGSVIYHMCAGEPPYSSNSIASTLHAVATSEPKKLRDMNPKVPVWLSDLIACLHARAPADRLLNATSVATALRSHIRPNRSVRQEQQRISMRSWIGGSVCLLAVVLMAGFLEFNSWGESRSSVFVAENSEELAKHIEEHEGDLDILLVSDGHYYLDALQIEGRSFKMVAGDGDKPTVIFDAEPDETIIHCEDGKLEFVGLRIELEKYEDQENAAEEELADDFDPVFSCSEGTLTLIDCEIRADARRCIRIFETQCVLRQCELYAEDTAIIFESSETTSVQLEDTMIQSKLGIEITEPTEGKIVLDTYRFDGLIAFEFMYSNDHLSRLKVISIGSDYLCDTALFSLYNVPATAFKKGNASDLHPSLQWRGEENTYPEIALLVFGDEEDIEREIPMGEWAAIDAALDNE